MINRNQLFQDYKRNMKISVPDSMVIMIFRSITDEQLANEFNLRVFRKGMFY